MTRLEHDKAEAEDKGRAKVDALRDALAAERELERAKGEARTQARSAPAPRLCAAPLTPASDRSV